MAFIALYYPPSDARTHFRTGTTVQVTGPVFHTYAEAAAQLGDEEIDARRYRSHVLPYVLEVSPGRGGYQIVDVFEAEGRESNPRSKKAKMTPVGHLVAGDDGEQIQMPLLLGIEGGEEYLYEPDDAADLYGQFMGQHAPAGASARKIAHAFHTATTPPAKKREAEAKSAAREKAIRKVAASVDHDVATHGYAGAIEKSEERLEAVKDALASGQITPTEAAGPIAMETKKQEILLILERFCPLIGPEGTEAIYSVVTATLGGDARAAEAGRVILEGVASQLVGHSVEVDNGRERPAGGVAISIESASGSGRRAASRQAAPEAAEPAKAKSLGPVTASAAASAFLKSNAGKLADFEPKLVKSIVANALGLSPFPVDAPLADLRAASERVYGLLRSAGLAQAGTLAAPVARVSAPAPIEEPVWRVEAARPPAPKIDRLYDKEIAALLEKYPNIANGKNRAYSAEDLTPDGAESLLDHLAWARDSQRQFLTLADYLKETYPALRPGVEAALRSVESGASRWFDRHDSGKISAVTPFTKNQIIDATKPTNTGVAQLYPLVRRLEEKAQKLYGVERLSALSAEQQAEIAEALDANAAGEVFSTGFPLTSKAIAKRLMEIIAPPSAAAAAPAVAGFRRASPELEAASDRLEQAFRTGKSAYPNTRQGFLEAYADALLFGPLDVSNRVRMADAMRETIYGTTNTVNLGDAAKQAWSAVTGMKKMPTFKALRELPNDTAYFPPVMAPPAPVVPVMAPPAPAPASGNLVAEIDALTRQINELNGEVEDLSQNGGVSVTLMGQGGALKTAAKEALRLARSPEGPDRVASLRKRVADFAAGIDKAKADKQAEKDTAMQRAREIAARSAAPAPSVPQYDIERNKRNAEAAETARLQEIGLSVVPGIRGEESEMAGRLWERLQSGDLARSRWEDWLDQLKRANKIRTPAAPAVDPEKAAQDRLLAQIQEANDKAMAALLAKLGG